MRGDVTWEATPLFGCDRKPSESTVTKVQGATLDDDDDIVPHSAVIRIIRNDDPERHLGVSTEETSGWGCWSHVCEGCERAGREERFR